MKLSLVTVSFHSQEELPRCVGSFRREVAAMGAEGEVVAVEQSEDSDVAAAVSVCDVDTVIARPNRGYAAGVNAGVGVATGDLLVVANPDVELAPGSLGRLAAAVHGGIDVAGPQLVWDGDLAVLMPVPEDPAPASEAWRAARKRWPTLWRRGLVGQIEASWTAWRADGPCPQPCLRGPMLVLDRSTWERLGPMDEGYFLYYEETEWLWRARRRGLSLALVGGAHAVHRWGHSTRMLTDRDAIEARSRRRFHRRNYGAVQRWFVGRLESRRTTRVGVNATAVNGPGEVPRCDADLWLLSPFAHLMPAGGWIGGHSPPAAVTCLTGQGRWYLAAVARRRGRWSVLGSWCWGRS